LSDALREAADPEAWAARLSASAYTPGHVRMTDAAKPLRPHTCLTVRLPHALGGELDVEAHVAHGLRVAHLLHTP